MHSNERFKHAEIELLSLYITSFEINNKEIRDELNKIDFIDEKHKLIKDFLDSLPWENISSKEIINKLFAEFNEFKHMMSAISDLVLRIELEDNVGNFIKQKDKILEEAKEWINWWVKNKQKLKILTDSLKECKDNSEETKILSEMIKVVKENLK